MKISLIGIGMDGIRTLTKEAETAIQESEILIGAERMLAPFQNSGKQLLTAYKPQEIADFLHKSQKSSASVLLSGDVGFYSGAEKLRTLLHEQELHICSGIASPVYFADKLGIPWENMKFISLHGIKNNIVIHVRQNPYCFFLLGGEMSAEKLCRKLCEYGMKQIKIHIGERLGYPEERILSGTAEEFQNLSVNALSVIIAENPGFCRNMPFLIPESDFYDDSVPEHVPVTKAEIRNFVISSLEIEKNHICWDIGSGTGSVSVGMALHCPDGKVYALDQDFSAYQLTNLNAHKFGCDNIEIFQGTAPELLGDFPAPDRAFIGGSSGNLKGIFEIIRQKNPFAKISITAVTLETLENAVHVFTGFGTEPGITQIAVTRTRKTGNYTMLNAQNPIFLIWGSLA